MRETTITAEVILDGGAPYYVAKEDAFYQDIETIINSNSETFKVKVSKGKDLRDYIKWLAAKYNVETKYILVSSKPSAQSCTQVVVFPSENCIKFSAKLIFNRSKLIGILGENYALYLNDLSKLSLLKIA